MDMMTVETKVTKGDSEQCPACQDDQFRCGTGQCLAKDKVCDGLVDCVDRSDEPENPDEGPDCDDSQVRCNNGKCIPDRYVCDGDNDCVDWREERCPCAGDEFCCDSMPGEDPKPPGVCIPEKYVCDEDDIWDCPTGSDEQNCTTKVPTNRIRQAHIQNRNSKLAKNQN